MVATKVWVVTSCVPGESEPVWPSVFASEEGAEAYLDRMLRAEWESNTPEGETCEPLPYPNDWRDANDELLQFLGETWGQWQLCYVEIEP